MAKSSIYTTPKNTQPAKSASSQKPAPAPAAPAPASGSVSAAPASTAAAPVVPVTPTVVISDADKGKTTGFLLLRLLLALLLLSAGIDKFKSPDPPYHYSLSNWHDTKNEKGEVEKTGRWLTVAKPVYEFGGFNNPAVFGEKGSNFLSWLFYWFAQTLPYMMILAGTMILLGLFTRVALFFGGAVWLSLAAGQMALPDNPTVFMLSTYVLMYALAASLVRFNRFAITRL